MIKKNDIGNFYATPDTNQLPMSVIPEQTPLSTARGLHQLTDNRY